MRYLILHVPAKELQRMLNKVKMLLDINDTGYDELLELFIELCSAQALEYTHRQDVSQNSLDVVVVLMVVESFNRLGSEGIANKSYSGITETPIDGYSDNIKRLLKSKRKIRTLG